MRYINRWGLMNNTRCENLSEHSLDVAVIAHCLVLIHNKRFGGNLNAERAALLALFHDATEIIKLPNISSLALAGKKGSNGCSSIFNKDFIKSLMIILLALVLF